MATQPHRTPRGGRIDRTAGFTLRFNGRAIEAHAGDTLASALLANGVGIVDRSFKYHRPRGVFSAGVEEPNALVQLRRGARTEANIPATVVEAYPDLEARSQTGWPSVENDLAASLLGPLARFMPAGFYYKTFIGPGRGTGWWMFCERFIRRAAAGGKVAEGPDPDGYEKVNAFCDVLVIGAGPAGLAAALAAGRAGARVMLVEQDHDLGGSLLAEPVGGAGDAWRASVLAELDTLPKVRILTRTTAFGAYDGEVYGLVERVWDHVEAPPDHQPRQRYWLVRAGAAVLASGAIEQPMVFGNNDLPGVMLATAVRSYLNRYGVLCSRRVVLCGGNDGIWRTAAELAAAGAAVTVADLRAEPPAGLVAAAAKAGATALAGHAVVAAHGRKAVSGATVAPFDAVTGRASAAGKRIDCDVIGVSGGFAPTLHLWSQRGGRPAYDRGRGLFLPVEGAVPRMPCAGAVAGEAGLDAAVAAGFGAGARAAGLAGHAGAAGALTAPGIAAADWARGAVLVPAIRGADGEVAAPAFVDLQHDAKRSDLELAQREGYVSIEHVKRYTTSGMGSDQGKTSNVNVLAAVADIRAAPVEAVGTTTFRPPFTPIAFGAIAAHEHGRLFRPTRLTPMHEWHAARASNLVQAGLWLRPFAYPRSGESGAEAALREARHVRQAVGLVDVSTLGKIAVQGPDAAELLDRVYVNGFRALKVGRLRYGLMLREDGFVLDDGTTARLGETEFLVSTTTVNAAKVQAHLEFLLQTTWTSLKVMVTSVTDLWAAVAVAGPAARKLLQAASIGADLSASALPHMALTSATIAEVPVRIHRMSYSGELSYEVYSPAGFGQRLWEALMEAGKACDAIPYGTEAMGIMRIEKGHVAGGELDGRSTLKDLGLERFASTRKPFVGSVLRHRPVLDDPDRPVLVGLRPLDPAAPIRPGALLFGETGAIAGLGEGRVTSAAWSPAVEGYVGLGLLARGASRIGETVRCADLLAGQTVPCRVTVPCFVDPEGVRQNA